MIDEHPPEADRGRFGNPAFKNWLHAVRQVIPLYVSLELYQ